MSWDIMSWDVALMVNDEIATVPHFSDGGTLPLGGTTDADLNITYNYGEVYRTFDFDLNTINSRRAGDFIEVFTKIVDACGTKTYRDYWAPTPGNAGAAIARLLEWAKLYPEGVFRVS